jgi:hypothetical protein
MVPESFQGRKGDVYAHSFGCCFWNGRRGPVFWTVEGECLVEKEYACWTDGKK